MSNWFHRLLNPHCSFCAAEREDNKYCAGCDAKGAEIEALKQERDRLLNHILNPISKQNSVQVDKDEDLQPIMPSNLPWKIRRRMLEENDRKQAEARKNAPKPDAEIAKENEELEKVLLDTSIPTEVALNG